MKKRNRSTQQLDEITEDGILCSIISSLALRDAVRTSILSHRWKHIWTQIPNLNFDGDMFKNDTLDVTIKHIDMEARDTFLRERTEKFIESVNAVLRHHQGTGVEAFRVNYFLKKIHARHLDRWIRFGITSKTKELVLELTTRSIAPISTDEPYNFPCQYFTGQRGSSIERLCLDFCSLKPPPGFDGFNYLKALDLNKVDVTEEDIKNLLSNCFILERLIVKRSRVLVNLKVSHPLVRLNYLCVEWCPQLEKIEFHAINLATFEYAGNYVKFTLGEASQLTKACISFKPSWNAMDYALTRLPSNMPHLKTLFMEIMNDVKVSNLPKNSNIFINLKHLVMIVDIISDKHMDLHSLASLLNAAPFMEKFELHMLFEVGRCWERRRTMLPKCPHNHLKTVEITGFTGSRRQVDFAIYLLNNAVGLELMRIDGRYREFRPFDRRFYRSDKGYISKLRTKPPRSAMEDILREVPLNVELAFL